MMLEATLLAATARRVQRRPPLIMAAAGAVRTTMRQGQAMAPAMMVASPVTAEMAGAVTAVVTEAEAAAVMAEAVGMDDGCDSFIRLSCTSCDPADNPSSLSEKLQSCTRAFRGRIDGDAGL